MSSTAAACLREILGGADMDRCRRCRPLRETRDGAPWYVTNAVAAVINSAQRVRVGVHAISPFYAQLAPLVLRAPTESQLITRIRGADAALSLEQMTVWDTRSVLLCLFQEIHATKATTVRYKSERGTRAC